MDCPPKRQVRSEARRGSQATRKRKEGSERAQQTSQQPSLHHNKAILQSQPDKNKAELHRSELSGRLVSRSLRPPQFGWNPTTGLPNKGVRVVSRNITQALNGGGPGSETDSLKKLCDEWRCILEIQYQYFEKNSDEDQRAYAWLEFRQPRYYQYYQTGVDVFVTMAVEQLFGFLTRWSEERVNDGRLKLIVPCWKQFVREVQTPFIQTLYPNDEEQIWAFNRAIGDQFGPSQSKTDDQTRPDAFTQSAKNGWPSLARTKDFGNQPRPPPFSMKKLVPEIPKSALEKAHERKPLNLGPTINQPSLEIQNLQCSTSSNNMDICNQKQKLNRTDMEGLKVNFATTQENERPRKQGHEMEELKATLLSIERENERLKTENQKLRRKGADLRKEYYQMESTVIAKCRLVAADFLSGKLNMSAKDILDGNLEEILEKRTEIRVQALLPAMVEAEVTSRLRKVVAPTGEEGVNAVREDEPAKIASVVSEQPNSGLLPGYLFIEEHEEEFRRAQKWGQRS